MDLYRLVIPTKEGTVIFSQNQIEERNNSSLRCRDDSPIQIIIRPLMLVEFGIKINPAISNVSAGFMDNFQKN